MGPFRPQEMWIWGYIAPRPSPVDVDHPYVRGLSPLSEGILHPCVRGSNATLPESCACDTSMHTSVATLDRALKRAAWPCHVPAPRDV